MGKPDPPQPPNPFQTAAAATGTNVSTAIANAFLGNVNQTTPTGSLQFNPTGQFDWTDPTTGHTYSIPRFTASQSLSPEEQAIQNTNTWTRQNLAQTGAEQAVALQQHFRQGFNLGNAPAAGSAQSLDGFDATGTIAPTQGSQQYTFGDAGDITRTYGDFANERNRIEQGLMDRLNPQLGLERQKYEQQLADQGIRYGSTAYTNAMDNYNRQANDARLAVIGQAGSEQQRMAEMAAQRAGFQNAAQQQAYEQAMGRGTFYNAAQAKEFQQRAMEGTFANSAAAQNFAQQQSRFNAANVARQQYINEEYARRNQPLNEIIALMSGSQVQNPNFVNANMPTIPTTDVAGLINQNFNQQMGIYNQEMNQWNSIMGGLLGAGSNLGSAFIRSDRDVKENVERMGTVFAEAQDGDEKKLPIYRYSYKDDPAQRRHVGPMAQDVEKIDKRAVKKFGGVRHIDVPKLGSILKAA